MNPNWVFKILAFESHTLRKLREWGERIPDLSLPRKKATVAEEEVPAAAVEKKLTLFLSLLLTLLTRAVDDNVRSA